MLQRNVLKQNEDGIVKEGHSTKQSFGKLNGSYIESCEKEHLN